MKHKGVSYNKKYDYWCASININGKRFAKCFKKLDDAIKYRKHLEELYSIEIDKYKKQKNERYIDENRKLIGKIFGLLTVIDVLSKNNKGKKQGYAICRCECGRTYSTLISRLKNGGCKSCGCLMKREKREKNTLIGSVPEKKRHITSLRSDLPYKNNTSGYRGVTLRKDNGSFAVQVTVNGKIYRCSRFNNAKEAYEYRKYLQERYSIPKVWELEKELDELSKNV